MARGDPTYCKIDVEIFSNGERFSRLSASEAYLYLALWALAVMVRSEDIPVDISTDKWVAEWTHKCRKSVHRWMDNLSRVGLITRNANGTLTIHKVMICHKKLRWDKLPQSTLSGNKNFPNRGGESESTRERESERSELSADTVVVRTTESPIRARAREPETHDARSLARRSDPPDPEVPSRAPEAIPDPRQDLVSRLEIEFGGNNGADLYAEILQRDISIAQITDAAESTRKRRDSVTNAFGFFRAQLRTAEPKPTTWHAYTPAPQSQSDTIQLICTDGEAESLCDSLSASPASNTHRYGLELLARFARKATDDERHVIAELISAAAKERGNGRTYREIVAAAVEAAKRRRDMLLQVKEL